jgi:hypothetical protein
MVLGTAEKFSSFVRSATHTYYLALMPGSGSSPLREDLPERRNTADAPGGSRPVCFAAGLIIDGLN